MRYDAHSAVIEGKRIAGRYRIEAKLARGGMGAVYSAIDESSGRRVALKRLLRRAKGHADRLFEHEFHTLSQLKHPRIIEVYEYGVDEQGAYYTMELLDGADLRDLSPLPYREACRHLRDVASSLALLHARRLLHRDISPRNVRLTSDGRAKLIDFGALATFGISERVVGTVPGVPPEALLGLELDQRSDLYSFGSLCYWLLTKHHAYPARELWLLPSLWGEGPPRPPSEWEPGIPPELDDLVLRLLSQDPLSRPTSAADVIERLEIIAELESEETLEVSASYLINPKLVGRERELSKLRSVLDRLKAGRSRAVLVEGPGGVGKTRLLSEIGLQAQIQGAVVVRVDAEAQQGPYAATRALCLSLFAKLPEVAARAAQPVAPVLAHFSPQIAERLKVDRLAQLPRDRGERRIRLQGALVDWIVGVARESPLVFIVDNVQAADESSLALLATLPKVAQKSPIALLLAQRTEEAGHASRTLQSVREASMRIPLCELSQTQTAELVTALFGDVHQAGRLGKWLYERTAGQPMHCLAFARQLIDLNLVTYAKGAWVLPLELSDEAVPGDVPSIFERQLSHLSPRASELAANLSVERRPISLEQCLVLSGMTKNDAFSALTELVSRGVLVAAGDAYRFNHDGLRERLLRALPAERRKRLHRQIGEFLLEQDNRDSLTDIEAGWHLLRGGQELRGAEILASAGERLVSTIEGLSFAAPALEEALEVFDRARCSPWVILPVLDALTSAGWYVDRKYADKYGQRTLDLALELSGLSTAERLMPFLGARLAVKAGTLLAAIEHGRHKDQIRSKALREFRAVFAPLIGTLTCLIGVAANYMDAARAESILETVRMMSAFPEGHIVSVMYDYARYYKLATEGRFSRAEPIALKVLDWLQTPAATELLTKDGTRALSGGVMTGLAQYGAFRDGSQTLAWADRLDALGLSFFSMIANQARFMYYAFRGEMTKARPHQERLELHAIQGGTTWQSSITVPLSLGIVYARTGDLVGLRHALEQLARPTEDVPSLRRVVKSLEASYELERGRPERALELIERSVHHPRLRSSSAWAVGAAVHARALMAVGRNADAQLVIERAQAELESEDASYTFTYLDLDLAKIRLYVRAERYAEAEALLTALLERHRDNAGPLTLFHLHEACAHVHLAQSNTAKLEAHLAELELCARNTENPALIAEFKRLESAARRGLGQRPSGIAPALARSDTRSFVKSLLETKEGVDRAAAALRIAVEQSAARGGYLYLGGATEFRLVAQLPVEATPPHALSERLGEMANAALRAPDFFSTTAAATAVLVGLASVQSDHSSLDELHADLLILPNAAASVVVGALVLKPGLAGLQPLGFDLLQIIAQALFEPADQRPPQAAADSRSG